MLLLMIMSSFFAGPSASQQIQQRLPTQHPSTFRSPAYRSVTEDYRQSQITLASSVHKALRDGEYAWLPDLVQAGQETLLWEPAALSGWTALHYAASHLIPLEWWKWILTRAATVPHASQAFRQSRDALGQTVLHVFLRSYGRQPLPWQSIAVKNRSQRFQAALRRVCPPKSNSCCTSCPRSSDLLSRVCQMWRAQRHREMQKQEANVGHLPDSNRSGVDLFRTRNNRPIDGFYMHDDPQENSDSRSQGNSSLSDLDTNINQDAIQRCLDFLTRLDLLCRATLGEFFLLNANQPRDSNSKQHHLNRQETEEDNLQWLAYLAQAGVSIPPEIVQLILALDPDAACRPVSMAWTMMANMSSDTIHTPDDEHQQMNGPLMLPLHWWSLSPVDTADLANCGGDGPQDAEDYLLLGLLQSFPGAAMMRNPLTGNVPLVDALLQGQPWARCEPLFSTAPQALSCAGPSNLLEWVNKEDTESLAEQLPVVARVAAAETARRLDSGSFAERVRLRARQRKFGQKGLISFWNLLSAQAQLEAEQEAEQDLEVEHLTTLYHCVLAAPHALPGIDSFRDILG